MKNIKFRCENEQKLLLKLLNWLKFEKKKKNLHNLFKTNYSLDCTKKHDTWNENKTAKLVSPCILASKCLYEDFFFL